VKPIEDRIFEHMKTDDTLRRSGITKQTADILVEAMCAIIDLRKATDCRFNCRANRKRDYVAGYEQHQKNMSLPGVESAQTMHLCFEEYATKKKSGAPF